MSAENNKIYYIQCPKEMNAGRYTNSIYLFFLPVPGVYSTKAVARTRIAHRRDRIKSTRLAFASKFSHKRTCSALCIMKLK